MVYWYKVLVESSKIAYKMKPGVHNGSACVITHALPLWTPDEAECAILNDRTGSEYQSNNNTKELPML